MGETVGDGGLATDGLPTIDEISEPGALRGWLPRLTGLTVNGFVDWFVAATDDPTPEVKRSVNLMVGGASCRFPALLGGLLAVEDRFHISRVVALSSGTLVAAPWAAGLSRKDLVELGVGLNLLELIQPPGHTRLRERSTARLFPWYGSARTVAGSPSGGGPAT